MALPKKGIRKVVVDKVEYYFTVQLEYYLFTIEAHIGLVEDPKTRFILRVKQGDEYLEKFGEDNIGSLTPGIICRAIEYVKNNTKWPNNENSIVIMFKENKFGVYDWKTNDIQNDSNT